MKLVSYRGILMALKVAVPCKRSNIVGMPEQQSRQSSLQQQASPLMSVSCRTRGGDRHITCRSRDFGEQHCTLWQTLHR